MTPQEVQVRIIEANLSRGLEIPENLSASQTRSRLVLALIAAVVTGMVLGHVFTRTLELSVEARLNQRETP